MKRDQLRNKRGQWDEADLVERLCHALDIAELAVEQLASEGYNDSRNPARNVRPEKIISETAILLTAVSAVTAHPEIDTRFRRVVERLIPHARSQRMMLGLCLEAAVAWDYAMPHVCLTRLGYRDPVFDELLGASLKAQARAGRERVPHRVLEQEWAAMNWTADGARRRRGRGATARDSILNHPMDLLNGTRDDVYAFTHALLYVTDLNLNPAPLPRRRPEILAEADAMLARSLDDEDYDLSGEVLLSWPLTGKSWSATAAFAFRVLAQVEDKAAFLPTPSTRIDELNALEGIERTRYLVATAYHTAYVMGLVCAASLHPGYAPPAAIPAGNAKPGAARQTLKLLDADGRKPHWRDEFAQLKEPEADALAGFLINVALRRRVASRDFGGVHELLKLAYTQDLAAMPAASQAAEMLQRFATYARITTAPRPEMLAARDQGAEIGIPSVREPQSLDGRRSAAGTPSRSAARMSARAESIVGAHP
jgi:hypothetical protein